MRLRPKVLMFDIPIETQHLAKNKNQDHAYENPGLFHVGADASVANDSDTVASSETSHTDSNTASKMQESPETNQYHIPINRFNILSLREQAIVLA
jgi:hypothetical protein